MDLRPVILQEEDQDDEQEPILKRNVSTQKLKNKKSIYIEDDEERFAPTKTNAKWNIPLL